MVRCGALLTADSVHVFRQGFFPKKRSLLILVRPGLYDAP